MRADSRRRRGLLLAGAAALGILASACTVLSDAHVLAGRLDDAGFLSTSITFASDNAGQPNDIVHVTTDVSARISGVAAVEREPQDVAEVVWKTFPYSFTGVEVTMRHFETVDFAATDLAALFGPRPKGLVKESVGQAVVNNAVNVVETALFSALGAAVFLVLVALLVMRYRRALRRSRGHEVREVLREISEKEAREANPLLASGQAARRLHEGGGRLPPDKSPQQRTR